MFRILPRYPDDTRGMWAWTGLCYSVVTLVLVVLVLLSIRRFRTWVIALVQQLVPGEVDRAVGPLLTALTSTTEGTDDGDAT